MDKKKRFWNWKNSSSEDDPLMPRELEIGGVIAEESWYDTDVEPKAFKDELNKGTGPVTVWINSPGGDCIAASCIYSALMDYPGEITVKISGLAASAASVVAMAGNRVEMAATAMMMVHNPATSVYGDHNEMKQAIKVLDEVKESIINAYEIKTNLPRDEISRLMENETWMNAKKAMELGFADGLLEDEKASEDNMLDDAFSFSARAGEKELMSKIAARCREKEMVDVSKKGASITELEKRLELLK